MLAPVKARPFEDAWAQHGLYEQTQRTKSEQRIKMAKLRFKDKNGHDMPADVEADVRLDDKRKYGWPKDREAMNAPNAAGSVEHEDDDQGDMTMPDVPQWKEDAQEQAWRALIEGWNQAHGPEGEVLEG